MTCSNCGKEIPMVGNVCPYCHVDKGRDVAIKAISAVGAVAGAGLGAITIGFWGFLGGLVIGGAIAAGVATAKLPKG